MYSLSPKQNGYPTPQNVTMGSGSWGRWVGGEADWPIDCNAPTPTLHCLVRAPPLPLFPEQQA